MLHMTAVTSSPGSRDVTCPRDLDVLKRGFLYVKRPPTDSAFKIRLKVCNWAMVIELKSRFAAVASIGYKLPPSYVFLW